MLVKMFKLNIRLYYFDGPIVQNTSEKKNFSSGKLDFYYSKTQNTPTINLFYNLNHYDKYYEESEYKKQYINEPLLKLDDIIIYEDNNISKNNNDGDNKLIKSPMIFFKNQNIKVCPKALKSMVDRVLFERARYLDLENYISKECNL
jgi:hypothetical protein